MKIALAQINPIVGDLSGNASKIIECINKARDNGCDLVVFPELSLTGSPLQDLVKVKDFIHDCQNELSRLLEYTAGIGVLIGTIVRDERQGLHSAVLLICDRRIAGCVAKHNILPLSQFGECCEAESPSKVGEFVFEGKGLTVTVGEGIHRLSYNESSEIIINISANPYRYGNVEKHIEVLSEMARRCRTPIVYVNQAGGNDDLVFAGASMIVNANGQVIALAKQFDEDMIFFDTHQNYSALPNIQEDVSWLYCALVRGIRDYFVKSGFRKTLLGLSGGIDAALVACIAADALSPENVLGVYMPSRYSSEHSRQDARQLAENLGIQYRVIPIEDIFVEYLKIFNGQPTTVGDVAEENIQARIRGSLLMFIANREGRVLLSTSNRSEAAVGYSTIYGDMCGGLSPISDIPKTLVYEICRYINRDREIIPDNIFVKPPSAELRPDQKDQDSLPPYEVLDAILSMYMDEELSVEEMVARGYDLHTVRRVLNLVERSEYKRRQAPLSIRVYSPAGRLRRNPVVHKYVWV
ncbi:MAG: NAD+ synthase [Clostridiales bacterium]|jgi:NAD+ synthase (glutamine-hydrolysing)|nr:NAD+ synthase [Clostridiales bacterium]